MSNKVHVVPDLPSTSAMIETTTARNKMTRKKKFGIISGVIGTILIIVAVVVPTTLILLREANNTITTEKSTPTTTKKPTPITTKARIKNTTSDMIHSSTTKPKDGFNGTESITNVWRLKSTGTTGVRTRYWYSVGNDPASDGWARDKLIFRAYAIQVPGTEPILAYHFEFGGFWHNTLQMDPMSSTSASDDWKLDSTTLYGYRTSNASENLQAISRYYSEYQFNDGNNLTRRKYLLKSETEEKEHGEWKSEEIIFYALPEE